MPEQSDIGEIRTFLADLGNRIGLGKTRLSWPRYLFHVTDVRNAASILADGALLSRTGAIEAGRMAIGNASQDVIDQTPEWVHSYARLFFRPKTPTFHNNEGIRVGAVGERGSHCAVPIAFLFDAASVISLPKTKMSDGSMANRQKHRANIGEGFQFLTTLPFGKIYSDGPMIGDKSELIFRRQAEVLVPNGLPLYPHLRFIFARSPAEQQTLVSLVAQESHQALNQFQPIITVNTKPGLFFKKWSFIEAVYSTPSYFVVRFNSPVTEPFGPFSFRMRAENLEDGMVWSWIKTDLTTDRSFVARKPGEEIGNVELSIYMDGCLAFRHIFRDSPDLIS